MLSYIFRRVFWSVPSLIAVSIVAFIIIQLPPGDWVTSYVAERRSQGETLSEEDIEALRDRYGLNDSYVTQYGKWMSNVLQSDFGRSFDWNKPVDELIWSRLKLTLLLSTVTLFLTWLIALPIGIYSAVRPYSAGDYLFTTIGFIGLAVPNFLLALVALYIGLAYFGENLTGLFSSEYVDAPWSMGKFRDLLSHLWIPVIIVGSASTAGLIRIMRANLLDELSKPYVVAARAKGLPEWQVILQYPVRVALNPFVATIGWTLPRLISGTVIVAVVLNLQTTGPMMLDALQNQDMYLGVTFVMLLSILTIIGTLISDILLAWLDPRIRYKGS